MRLTGILVATLCVSSTLAGCLMDETGEDATAIEPSDLPLPEAPNASFLIMIAGNLTEATNGSIETKAGLNLTFDGTASSGTNVTFGWDMGDGTTFGYVPDTATTPEPSPSNSTGNGTGGNGTFAPQPPLSAPGFQPNQTNTTSNQTTPSVEGPEGSLIVHAYLEPGNYTVTLFVTDEANQTAVSTADLTVGPPGPAPGTFIRTDELKFTQASTNALTACVAQTKDWVFVDAEPENGTGVEVANVTIVLDGSGTNVNGRSGVYFIGPDGKEIKSSASGFNDKKLEVVGPFVAGKYQVKAEICQVAVSASYTVSATATYVAT